MMRFLIVFHKIFTSRIPPLCHSNKFRPLYIIIPAWLIYGILEKYNHIKILITFVTEYHDRAKVAFPCL